MKLVVDANVLFTYFWNKSVFENISFKEDIQLFSPEYSLQEIDRYSDEIMRKTNITRKEFISKKEELKKKIIFVPLEEYSREFKKITLPKDNYNEFLSDIDFLSLALKLDCSLWSNDQLLKKQDAVAVLSTEEIINLLG